MGYGRGTLAATGAGLVGVGYYGKWWMVAIVVGVVVAGALLVRGSKFMRRDS
jgi:hypothetical protein